MRTPEPGVTQVVGVPRRHESARVKDAGGDWEQLGVIAPEGLYRALYAALPAARFAPVWIDVEIKHGYPMPTAQLLDSPEPLAEHLTMGVLQLLTTAMLRGARVQQEGEQ